MVTIQKASIAGTPSPLDPVVESGDALLFRRECISEPVFRKLRTAQFRVDGEIDQ